MIKNLLLVVGLLGSTALFAQKNPVVMEIDGKPITKSEFLQIYLKNNNNPKYDKASLDEYMELFRKFKLKVAEAESLGYDTIPKLKMELQGYRKTLSAPYLVDHETNDALVKEAYERYKKEIRASHILINLDPNASPADTLKAYNRVLALKKRIEAGEDFATVAKSAGGSEDPSVEVNGGDLGYFTAFQMVFPFEEAAYNTPVGKISNPVRTRFGYHILKVVDSRPARGTVKTAHIMIASRPDDSAEEIEAAEKKANEIYQKAIAGEDFTKLASDFSDDPGTNQKGGELPVFGSGAPTRMIPVYEEAAFDLKNVGDISVPVRTNFGFHIIKKLESKDLASFDEMKKDIQNKVNRDERSKKTQNSFVVKLKKEYKYEDKSKKTAKWFVSNLDSSYLQGNWKATKLTTDKPMFVLDGQAFTQKEFASYLEKNAKSSKMSGYKNVVNEQFRNWEKASILEYEESKLESKYPEFKALMQEYHDGILLYEVMTDVVWNKASRDTVGLEAFYKQNIGKYQWTKRVDALVYECLDQKIADEVYKMIQKETVTSKDVLEKINKTSELNLRVRTNKFEVSETPFLKDRDLKIGVNKPYAFEGKFFVIKVSEMIPAGPKELSDAKGIVTSDYQNKLEKDWLDELKIKHPIVIHEDVLYGIGK
ncbi:MAG: peptidylprolyl isomerase [Crocinitomicaceae bacterium]|nr:peptidylprolyl isomerase [Crocinitomicaceae bacterium]